MSDADLIHGIGLTNSFDLVTLCRADKEFSDLVQTARSEADCEVRGESGPLVLN